MIKSAAIMLGSKVASGMELRRLSGSGFVTALNKIGQAGTSTEDRIQEIIAACRDQNIDMLRSWFIGTDASEMEIAHRIGMRSVLLRTEEEAAGVSQRPDFECLDIAAAAELILDLWPAIEPQARQIAARMAAGETVVIGGLARTGKSTWASALAIALRTRRISATVISLDGWLRDLSSRPPQSTVLDRYAMEAVSLFIETMPRGGVVNIPVYDRLTRSCRGSYCAPIGKDDVIILEGVIALMVNRIEQVATHRIFVQRPEPARYSAMLADYMARGYSFPAFEELYESRLTDELPIVLASRRCATLCLDTVDAD